VTASDPSPRAVKLLQERFEGDPNVEVVEGDAETVAGGNTYDSIVMVNVLEHIPDDVGALRALKASLNPGGRIIVYVPAFNVLYSRFDRAIGHYRRYRRKTLALAFRRAGLEDARVHYVNGLGFFAWLVHARVLRQTPTRGWATRLYDRTAVPVLRRLEHDNPPPFGQSVLGVAVNRAD